jgi:hypothetical protein
VAEALNFDKSNFTTLDYTMGFGHIFILLFHFYAIVSILRHFHCFEEVRILKIIVLILSVISLFAIGGQKVLIDEIAREYRFGLDLSELTILNIAYLINMAFTTLMFVLILTTFKLIDVDTIEKKYIDERIFTIAQCMGILSGIMGLWLTFTLIRKNILMNTLWMYLPFYILFLIPYMLAVIYWLSCKSKKNITEWYDEKQFQDILKSSLTTLLLSVPGLAMLLFFTIPDSLYWLLYYLFFILLIFSSSTLYYFKIKDRV